MSDRVNWSTLKELAKSPAHYRHAVDVGREDTAALRLGRAIHVAVLEPAMFVARYRAAPDGLDRRTKAGKEWCAQAAAEGVDVLSYAEHEMALGVQASVRANPACASIFAAGSSEVEMQWERCGVECRGRADWIGGWGQWLADLKTTRDASPVSFGAQARRYQYTHQLAWYRRAVEISTGCRPRCVLIAAEKCAPYVAQPYEVPEAVLDECDQEIDGLLARLVALRSLGGWGEGYCRDLPALHMGWSSATDDEDEDDLGVSFGGVEE